MSQPRVTPLSEVFVTLKENLEKDYLFIEKLDFYLDFNRPRIIHLQNSVEIEG